MAEQCGHDVDEIRFGLRLSRDRVTACQRRWRGSRSRWCRSARSTASPRARRRNPVELLSARKAAGSRPSALARATVSPSTRAPAGSLAAPAPPSVPSVSAASAANRRHAGQAHRQRQGVFLVGPAAALAADGDRQFAARQDHRARALRAQLARELGVRRRHLARLAFDAIAQRNAFVAGGAHGGLRRAQRIGRPRGQREWAAGESRIARLRRFIVRVGERARSRLLEDRAGICATMARARASVVGSGTVGPEPIAEGSSPGTSEIAIVTSFAG